MPARIWSTRALALVAVLFLPLLLSASPSMRDILTWPGPTTEHGLWGVAANGLPNVASAPGRSSDDERAATGDRLTRGDIFRKWWLAIAIATHAIAATAVALYVIRLNRKLRASGTSLRRLALHDTLTKLPNRALFEEAAERSLANANRHGSMLSVLFIDLDDFKPVNDEFGHAVGDLLLQEVAVRLLGAIRKGDIAARIGGDEFVILLDSIRGEAGVREVMERLLASIGSPYFIHGVEVAIGCSVGAASLPNDGPDLSELMRHADEALRAAKLAGKGRGLFFAELVPA